MPSEPVSYCGDLLGGAVEQKFRLVLHFHAVRFERVHNLYLSVHSLSSPMIFSILWVHTPRPPTAYWWSGPASSIQSTSALPGRRMTAPISRGPSMQS